MAAQALVDSAIAFCNDSLVQHLRLDSQRAQPGTAEFDVTPPPSQAIARVLRVWIDGCEIHATPSDCINDGLASTGWPRTFYTQQNSSVLSALLYPIPDAAYLIQVEVATRPLRNAKSLENDLFDLWMEPIVEGAKARLMAIPDQPFSNPGMAGAAAANAMYLSRKARIEGSYGRTRAAGRVQMRPLA